MSRKQGYIGGSRRIGNEMNMRCKAKLFGFLRSTRDNKLRVENGAFLIETLVALSVASIVTFALLQMLGQTLQVSSSSGNRQAAQLIAETVLDAAKASRFDAIAPGKYDLVVNSSVSGTLAPGSHPLPVWLNMADLNWLPKSISNKFSGTAQIIVTNGALPSSKSVAVSVSWNDSQNLVGKTFSTCTTIHKAGLNSW